MSSLHKITHPRDNCIHCLIQREQIRTMNEPVDVEREGGRDKLGSARHLEIFALDGHVVNQLEPREYAVSDSYTTTCVIVPNEINL